MENENIHRIAGNNRELIFVGTSHLSRGSIALVEQVISEEKPDVVCIELCTSRYATIMEKDRWDETDFLCVMRQKQTPLLLFQLMTIPYQKKMTRKFNINPGEGMIRAIDKAKEVCADIVPADRDIRITFMRVWRKMRFAAKIKAIPHIILSFFIAGKITEKDIDELNKRDLIEIILNELPDSRKILINEREQYLSHTINHVPGHRIVAVVDSGHIPGIIRSMEEKIDMEALTLIPTSSQWSKFGWLVFSAAVIAFLITAFFYSGSQESMSMIKWMLATATCSGIGALILLAHPVTIMASMITAPISALHPLIAAGWVAGLTEAAVRKPRVKDFLHLTDDIASISGFFRNKITRLLLLVAIVNLTTSIGTFIAIPVMMRFF